MRQIVENVSDECHKAGIHTPAHAFDGQWHNIAVRTKEGSPLTILHPQKDVWREVEKIQKSGLVSIFKGMNKIVNCSKEDGKIICSNGGLLLPRLRITRKTHKGRTEHTVACATLETNTARLVDSIPTSVLEDSANHEILSFVTVNDEEREAFSANISDMIWNYVLSTSDHSSDSLEVENETNVHDKDRRDENMSPLDAPALNENDVRERRAPTYSDAENILSLLQTDGKCNRGCNWSSVNPNELLTKVSTTHELQMLRDIELKVILRYYKHVLSFKAIESCSQSQKIESLIEHLQIHKTNDEPIPTARKTKQKLCSPKTLKDTASSFLMKSVQKHDLNVSYAEYIWPAQYKDWCEESCLRDHPKINETDYPEFWFYIPEFSESRKQLEVKCIDSTHLLTRTRRVSCRGGLDGISNYPWLQVAKQGKTFLSLIMVQEVVEPMTTMMASTHFSEAVELEIRRNGHSEAANLCRDIRHWWQSEDDPGIPADERIVLRQNLRERLLKSVNFSRFPPPTQYIKGWPIQLWEALIANIDAKSLLYPLCHGGTYNIRAFSSLMGETFFSELTLNDKCGHGTVTADEFGRFIGSTVEKLQIRQDPQRKFTNCTSKTSVYNLVDNDSVTDEQQSNDDREQSCTACSRKENPIITEIYTRDHAFDALERKAKKGRRKVAYFNENRTAVEKGSLEVRWEKARRNDSKLLPTSRMGIDDTSLQ